MPLSMSEVSVPLFLQGLKGLSGVLGKAQAQAEAKGIPDVHYLHARLYPDMLPMARQVQIACDFAKGPVARLAGADMPSFEDTETSFDDLKDRVAKTIAYIESVPAASIDGSEDKDITLVRRGETFVFKGLPYLMEQALPNFFFHITTAYAILRHNGVEIGKKDFLGTA